MIAQLRGQVLRKSPQEVVVDVGGVGYRVLIPVSTFYRLPGEGDTVSLLVHTHVREDSLSLFGFFTDHEQSLFARLIEVAGVGPKLAVNILSGIEAPDLMQALRAGDLARLTRVPGVGKKTAERLIVELKDKMPALAAAPEAAPAGGTTGAKDDLLSALVNLGYSRGEAEKGADRALREGDSGRFEDLLRGALRAMAGR